MIINNVHFSEFAETVKKRGANIIIYGAGVLGMTLAPCVLKKLGLEEKVLFFVDADKGKQGEYVDFCGRNIPIKPVKVLNECGSNTVILITNSVFYSVTDSLDKIPDLDNIDAYILPVMQLSEKKKNALVDMHLKNESVIPKMIHYCWFSGAPIPPMLQKCIDSWNKYCPNYEIIRWDESNYDVSKNKYTKQAHENKKWAYVSDIAKLEILYNYGGIYLDTDVELIKNLDPLLYQSAFCGTEKWGIVNFGGCSGAVKGNKMIKKILDFRYDIPFIKENGAFNLTASGYYEMAPLLEKGMKIDDTFQIIDGFSVLPSDFFHPYDYMSGITDITENTFSIHHFNGSWLGEKADYNKKMTRQYFKKMMSELSVKSMQQKQL